MASIPSTSRQTIAAGSSSSKTTEEDERGYETNLSTESTNTEININTNNWSNTDKKKLQHMTEFHTEYQHVFGERASVRAIMKRRIHHMNPPCLKLFVKRKCKMPN